jgi:hypothetical protein
MTDAQALERGRALFARKAWTESYRLLQAADCDAPLEPEDLERLAIAVFLAGQDDDCEAFTARAHRSFLDRGDREGAARAAFWLGFARLGRGAMAPASGWFARAERVLDEGQLDCGGTRVSADPHGYSTRRAGLLDTRARAARARLPVERGQ